MGIGAKIKDALHGDKETHKTTTDTSKTPGSFPSEEVPRTHGRNETHGNSHGLDSTSEPRTEKLPGKNSAEYTYGSKADTAGHTAGTAGRHSHEISGTHQDTGLGHKGVSGSGATSTGNKLTKGHNDPYWGDSERRTHEPGTGIGAHGSTGNDLNAREINDRYNNTSQGGDLAHAGTTGHFTGRPENLTGGTSGRDHDRYDTPGNTTHTSTTTTTGYGSSNTHGSGLGSSGAPEGTHGPHGSRVANAADPRVDSDRDHRAAPGTTGIGSTGPTSNLAHRAHDTDTSRRDYKTDEYDAPTNSSGRGHGLGGAGTGIAGGAAAGYGASKLADRHHEHDAREKDPSFGGQQYGDRRGNDVYDNIGSREHGSGTGAGLLDPHGRNTATQPGTGAGTSMLDPYGTESGSTGHHTGHHTGAGSGPGAGTIRLQDSHPGDRQGHSTGSGIGHHAGAGAGTGLGAGSHLQGQYPEGRQDYNTGTSGLGAGSGLHESHERGHHQTVGSGTGATTGSHVPGVGHDHHATSGLGSGEHDSYGRDAGSHNLGSGNNLSQGSSEYSQEGSNLAKGHFGPGHDGAKVMHKCDNCGHDNDISKHFRKDAVYRMG